MTNEAESNRLWAVVRLAAEVSDWKRDQGETLIAWADRKLRGMQSETGSVVDGVDVPHAWPQEALDGPKSEPEALVAWLDTARRFGAEEAIKIMQRRLNRLEELRNG